MQSLQRTFAGRLQLRRIKASCLFLLWSVLVSSESVAGVAAVGDDEILQVLQQRIDVLKQGVGIVVGVIDEKGRRIVAHGRFAPDDPRPVNGDTVFEIGSITKVFTSLALADMARRAEVSLDDPVAKLHQNGRDMPAPRIGDDVPQRASRTRIEIDAALYERYVGEYRLAPAVVVTVARSGDGLFVQLTGQPMLQVYPQSATTFFYEAVEAQVTFHVDAEGPASALTLHQGGRNLRAPRQQ